MKTLLSIALCGATVLSSVMAIAQAVHVTSEKGMVMLSVAAQKPYMLMGTSQPKTPVLTVTCQQKGRKTGHSVTFLPGGILTEQEYSTFGSSASLALVAHLGEQTFSTNWVAYGNVETFTYYGKTEQERVAFLHALLKEPSLTLEFTPFLTGVPTSTTFQLTELRAEYERHTECVSNH